MATSVVVLSIALSGFETPRAPGAPGAPPGIDRAAIGRGADAPVAGDHGTGGQLQVTGMDPTVLGLSWNGSSEGAQGTSTLQVSTEGPGGPWSNVTSVLNATSANFTVTGLAPATTYDYQVAVQGPLDRSASSSVLRATQPRDPRLVLHPHRARPEFAWTNYATYGGPITFSDYVFSGASSGGPWTALDQIGDVNNTTLALTSPFRQYDQFEVTIVDFCCGEQAVSNPSDVVNISWIAPLSANAAVQPAAEDVGQAGNFSCSASGGLPPYQYLWSFGDGTSSDTANTTHAYRQPGIYTAQCTVTDLLSDPASSTDFSLAVYALPAVNATVSHAVADPGYALEFNASVTGGLAPLRSISWNFGDGGTADGARVTHGYTAPGNFTAVVTVVDSAGGRSSASVPVRIAPLLVAGQVSESDAAIAQTLNFSGAASGGAGPPYSYLWEFGDGGTATGPLAEHAYLHAGNYTVELTVTDGLGVAANVSLANVEIGLPLTAHIGLSDALPPAGDPINLSAAVDGGIGAYQCTWAFGDSHTATGCTTSHAWASPSEYTVVLTVGDASGGKVSARTIVTVRPATATIPIAPPPTGPFAGVLAYVGVAVIAALLLVGIAVAWNGARHRPAGRKPAPHPPAAGPVVPCPECGATAPAGAPFCPVCERPLGP